MTYNSNMTEMKRRVDEFGRAFAGSQLQIQTYVNCRRGQLDAAILNALPELAERGASLEWVSPLAEKRFVECHDGSFLSALGLQDSAGLLVEFWPQGGPHWDALAKINWNDGTPAGVLLVEAKSYPAEMFSNGCLAGEVSLTRIIRSIESTRKWLNASAGNPDLDAWTGRLYQFANRLAHLYFLREITGVSAWLVNVCFAHDPHSPTPIKSWEQALESAKAALGLGGLSIPFYADVILEALDRELFQVGATTGGSAPNQVSYAPRKEWRFLRNDRTGRHQFLGFVNARGSSSLRFFDADSGLLLGEPRYGRKQPYENAFVSELSASTPLAGPPVVSNVQIALDQLGTMRSQAGLNPTQRDPSPTASRSSILAGVDAIVDQALGICQIGRTSPHYRHLTAYRALATGSRCVDGPALITEMYCRIVRNWPGTRCRGSENWRWEKKTYISEQNDSLEKRFEKGLAAKCGEWYNMIPVASGVMPDVDEGGRRIDLARCYGRGRFEFVELKLGNPAIPLCTPRLKSSDTALSTSSPGNTPTSLAMTQRICFCQLWRSG